MVDFVVICMGRGAGWCARLLGWRGCMSPCWAIDAQRDCTIAWYAMHSRPHLQVNRKCREPWPAASTSRTSLPQTCACKREGFCSALLVMCACVDPAWFVGRASAGVQGHASSVVHACACAWSLKSKTPCPARAPRCRYRIEMKQNPDIQQRRRELLQLIKVCWRLSGECAGKSMRYRRMSCGYCAVGTLTKRTPSCMRVAARRAASRPANAARQLAEPAQGADHRRRCVARG